MRRVYRIAGVIVSVAVLLAAGGCGIEGRKTQRASSVVDFLYPDKVNPVDTPTIPHLNLPMTVGIAFVPPAATRYTKHDLDAEHQIRLMNRIADSFRQHEFIGRIEIIPAFYLRTGGSFDNLDQLRTMYGVDVITLLSYDQIQYTDEGLLSLTYWTIVGAYVFPGEKNDTSTMVDAAVYDIRSRRMLFRAPGVSQVKGLSTLVNSSEELRHDSRKGFELAADQLVVNLQGELERFKTRVKERPEEFVVTTSPGYTGGGSLGNVFVLLAVVLLIAAASAHHGPRGNRL